MSVNKRITIHIEQLILDGVSIPQRHRPLVQAALEQELARLLTHGDLAATLHTNGTLAHIPAGTLTTNETHAPRLLGEQIARAVYEGIGQ